MHTYYHTHSCLSSAFILHLGRPSKAKFSLFPTQHSNSSQASMRSSCAVVAFCVLSDMDWHWAAKAAISRWMLAKSWSAFSTCAWKKETGIETHPNGYLLVEVKIYCRCFCWFCMTKKKDPKAEQFGKCMDCHSQTLNLMHSIAWRIIAHMFEIIDSVFLLVKILRNTLTSFRITTARAHTHTHAYNTVSVTHAQRYFLA